MDAAKSNDDAPALQFPDTKVVALEHPCIIRNIDRGVKSLGGNNRIEEFLQAPLQTPKKLYVSLRPEDQFATKIPSQKVKTNNFLLKITAPKRTGRRRKRGSNDAFRIDPNWDSKNPMPVDSRNMMHILKDNPSKITVSPVAALRETHRFRALQDFQYASTTSTLMQNLRGGLLSGDFEKLKGFVLDPTRGLAPGQDIQLPPRIRLAKDPIPYNYRQNLSVRVFKDEHGVTQSMNVHKTQPLINHILPHDSDEVPSESPVELPPEDTLEPRVRKCIELLRNALEKRPVMSRRVQMSVTKSPTEMILRSSWAYLGYMFKSGPFKDTLIKFGVDPRTDSKYREYQSIAIQVPESEHGNRKRYGRAGPASKRPRTYIFDGKGVYVDGKVWQVCDISDPLLKRLAQEAGVVEEYEPTISGWFGNGVWSMIRIIMKDKVNRVIHNNPVHDSFYDAFINAWPDHLDELNVDKTYPDANTNPELVHLMNQARARALMALREARVERKRRRRLKGDAEKADDEVEISGDSSEISSLSDIGSSMDIDGDVDADEDMDERSAGDSSEKD